MTPSNVPADASPVAIRATAVILVLLLASVAVELHATLAALVERPRTTVDSIRLDPRIATAGEWQLIPGIGPVSAARIVAFREQHGPAALMSVDDATGRSWSLSVVPGVGPVAARRAAPYLRPVVDDGTTP